MDDFVNEVKTAFFDALNEDQDLAEEFGHPQQRAEIKHVADNLFDLLPWGGRIAVTKTGGPEGEGWQIGSRIPRDESGEYDPLYEGEEDGDDFAEGQALSSVMAEYMWLFI